MYLMFSADGNKYAIEITYLESIRKDHSFRSVDILPMPFIGFIYYQGIVYNVLTFSKEHENIKTDENKKNVLIFKDLYIAVSYEEIINVISKNNIEVKNVENPELLYLKQYFIYEGETYYIIDGELFKKYFSEIFI